MVKTRYSLRVASVTLSAACLAILGRGCGSGDTTATPGPDARGPVDAASGRDSRPKEDEPEPSRPEGVPDGWVRYDGMGKWCGLYVPTAREQIPAELDVNWTPCPSDALPAGMSCQLIEPTWTSSKSRSLISPSLSGALDSSEQGHFQLTEFRGEWAYRLIIDQTGHVESAILETDGDFCSLGNSDMYDNKYVYMGLGGDGYGAIGGVIGELTPSLAITWPWPNVHEPHATAFGVLDSTAGFTLNLYGWSDGKKIATIWSAAQDLGLQQHAITSTSDALTWRASNEAFAEGRLYTSDGGVVPFRSFGSDFTRGDFCLGTDEHDFAWIYASGRKKPSGSFPKLDIMTAPYTTDMSKLAPRRLRSESGFAVDAFTVGCGYAALSNVEHVRLVRLSDGVSWLFPGNEGAVIWARPVVLTCDELFMFGNIRASGKNTLARISLASLGPGIPPD